MEVRIFVVLCDGFDGLSDLANLFGVDSAVFLMCQLVSHQPKAPNENLSVC